MDHSIEHLNFAVALACDRALGRWTSGLMLALVLICLLGTSCTNVDGTTQESVDKGKQSETKTTSLESFSNQHEAANKVVFYADAPWKIDRERFPKAFDTRAERILPLDAIDGPIKVSIVSRRNEVSLTAANVSVSKSSPSDVQITVISYESDPDTIIALAKLLCVVSGIPDDQIRALEAKERTPRGEGQLALQNGESETTHFSITVRRGFESRSQWRVVYNIDLRLPPGQE